MFDCLWSPIHGQFWFGRKSKFYISESANQLCHFIVPNANRPVPLRTASGHFAAARNGQNRDNSPTTQNFYVR